VKVKPDPALLETLVYITEYPTPILGGFDPEFLKLPEEVLVTVMRHHQKYFSVADDEGRLAPHFAAVMNTSADPEGLVRRGNERCCGRGSTMHGSSGTWISTSARRAGGGPGARHLPDEVRVVSR